MLWDLVSAHSQILIQKSLSSIMSGLLKMEKSSNIKRNLNHHVLPNDKVPSVISNSGLSHT